MYITNLEDVFGNIEKANLNRHKSSISYIPLLITKVHGVKRLSCNNIFNRFLPSETKLEVCNRFAWESACMACKRSPVRSRYSPPKIGKYRQMLADFYFFTFHYSLFTIITHPKAVGSRVRIILRFYCFSHLIILEVPFQTTFTATSISPFTVTLGSSSGERRCSQIRVTKPLSPNG